MSISTLSGKLLPVLLFLGLAAMFVSSTGYFLSGPSLIKKNINKTPVQPGSAAAPDAGMGGAMNADFMERISDLMGKLKENPNDFDTRMELAEMFMMAKEVSGATVHLQKAVELRPDSQEAHHKLGAILYGLERYEESARSLEKALALEEDAGCLFNLGMIYIQHLDKAAEGRALLERAAAAPDASPDLLNHVKDILKEQGK